MRHLLFAVALLAAAAPALGEPALQPYRAVYHATVKMIPVRARVALEHRPDDTWVYESKIEPRGWAGFISRELKETSVVSVAEDDRIVPSSYRKRDEMGGRNSDIRFDSDAGEMEVRYKGKAHTAAWDPGIVDLMALRLVLANDLALGRLAETYRVVDDKGRIRTVSVEEKPPEVLETDVGPIETVLVEYREDRKDRFYRAWLAPGLGGMIVRLEQYEEGKLRGTLELAEHRLGGRPDG
jgi:hypothetical protein